jgi:hypothetical protein
MSRKGKEKVEEGQVTTKTSVNGNLLRPEAQCR